MTKQITFYIHIHQTNTSKIASCQCEIQHENQHKEFIQLQENQNCYPLKLFINKNEFEINEKGIEIEITQKSKETIKIEYQQKQYHLNHFQLFALYLFQFIYFIEMKWNISSYSISVVFVDSNHSNETIDKSENNEIFEMIQNQIVEIFEIALILLKKKEIEFEITEETEESFDESEDNEIATKINNEFQQENIQKNSVKKLNEKEKQINSTEMKQKKTFNESIKNEIEMNDIQVIQQIIEKYREYLLFKKQIQRTQSLLQTKQNELNKNELFLLQMKINEEYTSNKMNEIQSLFTCKEREELKLFSLDAYSIMITSKYFNTIEDFKNIEICSRKFNGNIDKFHYNPIPLTQQIRPLFTHLETLEIYPETVDKLISLKEKNKIGDNEYHELWKEVLFMNDDNIFQRRYTNPIDFNLYKDSLPLFVKSISFPRLRLKRESYLLYLCETYPEIKEIGPNAFTLTHDTVISIPTTITRLERCAFNFLNTQRNITLPTTISSLPDNLFQNCLYITSIQLPSTITSIGNKCFLRCERIQELSIPKDIKFIGYDAFNKCGSLTKLTINSQWHLVGNRIFNWENNILKSVQVPSSLRQFNSQHLSSKDLCELGEYIIPDGITTIYDYCFADCTELRSITIPSTVKYIGKYAFLNCPLVKTTSEKYQSFISQQQIQPMISQQELHLLEEWSLMKYKEIVFDSDFDCWNQYNSVFVDKIFNKKNLMIVIEDIDGNIFGGFVSKSIDRYNIRDGLRWKGEDIIDSKAFCFSLRSHYKLQSPHKFHFKQHESRFAFGLYEKRWGVLFTIGDITILKENSQNDCSCSSSAFDYSIQNHSDDNSNENESKNESKSESKSESKNKQNNQLLTDGINESTFTPKHFQIYQMEETEQFQLKNKQLEKHRQERIEKEKEIIQTKNLIVKQIYDKEIKQIEKWTCLQCSTLLFDSEYCCYDIVDSTFDKHIFGKENILVLIETNDEIRYGGFLYHKVDQYRYLGNNAISAGIVDPKSFIFTFKNKKPKRYFMKKEKESDKAFLLYHHEDHRLMCFGEGDVFIGKKGMYSFCRQDEISHFNCENDEFALVGEREIKNNTAIEIKRIVVFEFK